jgi:hypothetical protein
MHDGSSTGHIRVACTLAKALDIFWWKQIRQEVKDICERFGMCRRAKIKPQIAQNLYPLHVPPIRPWHTLGHDFFTRLPLSNGSDNVIIVVDHVTRMVHFLPCTQSVTIEETASPF